VLLHREPRGEQRGGGQSSCDGLMVLAKDLLSVSHLGVFY